MWIWILMAPYSYQTTRKSEELLYENEVIVNCFHKHSTAFQPWKAENIPVSCETPAPALHTLMTTGPSQMT